MDHREKKIFEKKKKKKYLINSNLRGGKRMPATIAQRIAQRTRRRRRREAYLRERQRLAQSLRNIDARQIDNENRRHSLRLECHHMNRGQPGRYTAVLFWGRELDKIRRVRFSGPGELSHPGGSVTHILNKSFLCIMCVGEFL